MCLTLPMVRAAIAESSAVGCLISSAQLCAWEMLAIGTAEIIAEEIGIEPDQIVEFIKHGPKTVGGLPVYSTTAGSDFGDKTSVLFIGSGGQTVAKIENLAIPVAFA